MSSTGSAQAISSHVRYLEQADLKEKYKANKQPRTDRIEVYCKSIKSIGLATNLEITVEKKDKHIIRVAVSADPHSPKQALEKALNYIVGEFIKADCQRKYGGNGISGPRKANKVIDEDKQRNIQEEGERCLPLNREALRRHDLLVNCELRQFRCPECLKPFWRTVFINKPVARCHGHEHKLLLWPLKRTEEFGVGRFVCTTPTCDNVFYGRCRATDIRQCKFCFSEITNPYIHPRFRPPAGPLPHGVRKPLTTANDLPVSKIYDGASTCLSTFVRQWDETTTTESLRSSHDTSEGPPQMPCYDFDQAEAQRGNDDGSDSDPESECGTRDRRRPHKSQLSDSD